MILQTLLGKSEEKVKNGEQILQEYANVDSTVAVSHNDTAGTDASTQVGVRRRQKNKMTITDHTESHPTWRWALHSDPQKDRTTNLPVIKKIVEIDIERKPSLRPQHFKLFQEKREIVCKLRIQMLEGKKNPHS